MDFIKVTNWDKFQHYSKRNPPWIKLHRSLLHDYEYQCLQDASKAHLVGIWLLASQTNNKIPADPRWIANQIGATEKINLKPLIDNGYIECYQDASKVQAKCYSQTETETETETEKDTSEPTVPACPHFQIIDIYHKVLPERPTVVKERWTGSPSERELRARWRESEHHRDLDFWRAYFNSVRASDWRMGRDKWRGVDLHWLVKRTNFDKVVQDWANAA